MFSHISALLKLSMSIFLICGAALLYRDASNTGIRVVSTASGTKTLVGNGSSAIDNGAGGFLLVGMTFFFIATMIDTCRDCKLACWFEAFRSEHCRPLRDVLLVGRQHSTLSRSELSQSS